MKNLSNIKVIVNYEDQYNNSMNKSIKLDLPVGCGENKCAYDFVDKWVIMISNVRMENLNSNLLLWKQIIEQEIIGSQFCSNIGLLNSINKRCSVTMHDITFETYISRNFASLKRENIYVVDRKAPIYHLFPTHQPIFKKSDMDLSDPAIYQDIILPVINDIIIMYKNKLAVGYDTLNFAYVRINDSSVVNYNMRLFLFDFYRGEYNKVVTKEFFSSYIGKLDTYFRIIKYAVKDVMIRIESLITDKLIEEVSEEYEIYANNIISYYSQVLTQCIKENSCLKHNLVKIVAIDESINNKIMISRDINDRNLEFIVATIGHQDKNYAIALLYIGVDIMYNEGKGIINSVSKGDDYLLKHLSHERFIKFLRNRNRATKLLVTAYEYIIKNDDRTGKENSWSYKALKDAKRGGYYLVEHLLK